MVNGAERPAELRPFPGLHLDERYRPIPLDHQVDVPVAAAKAALHHAPPPPRQPPLRDPLSELPERLPGH
jgi:hypothetical protein